MPDTLVRWNFHPGNLRGDGRDPTLLDWGDSGVGHPFFDQLVFLERCPAEAVGAIAERWNRLWLERLPGSNPFRMPRLDRPPAQRPGRP